jgi:DNA-binding response OmpR family regulator
MKRVLLIEDEPLISDLIVDCFDAEAECASDGFSGARMIAGWHFDLAVIDVGLPLISGFELAGFAANENIPVLLVSGHPGLNEKLRRFGYPYLEKPFGLNALCAEAVRAIGESQENIRRVKDPAARMSANTEGLSAALAEPQRLLRDIKAQQIMLEMGKARVQSP